jgi:hypothetical protein
MSCDPHKLSAERGVESLDDTRYNPIHSLQHILFWYYLRKANDECPFDYEAVLASGETLNASASYLICGKR